MRYEGQTDIFAAVFAEDEPESFFRKRKVGYAELEAWWLKCHIQAA